MRNRYILDTLTSVDIQETVETVIEKLQKANLLRKLQDITT